MLNRLALAPSSSARPIRLLTVEILVDSRLVLQSFPWLSYLTGKRSCPQRSVLAQCSATDMNFALDAYVQHDRYFRYGLLLLEAAECGDSIERLLAVLRLLLVQVSDVSRASQGLVEIEILRGGGIHY